MRIIDVCSLLSSESSVTVKTGNVIVSVENEDSDVGSTLIEDDVLVVGLVAAGARPVPGDDLEGEFGFSFSIEIASNVNASIFRVENNRVSFGHTFS